MATLQRAATPGAVTTRPLCPRSPSAVGRAVTAHGAGARPTARAAGAGRRARPALAARRSVAAAAELRNIDWPQALLFDCDGVLVDTERDGHRPAFNEAFKRKGLGHVEWGVEEYGVLLETGGGKERMTAYFNDHADAAPWATVTDPAERKALVADLHKLKTAIFQEKIEAGALPLRPGVARLVAEARAAGVPVAVCSTSAEAAVSTIVRVLLGPDVAKDMRVFAGDVVPKKKPDPAIYLLAAAELGVDPARCVVVEDSEIGLAAARAAGMRCIVTRSAYTQDEAFDGADAVFDCIGDAGDERFSLDDLTTPGSFWLNPPLPRDADGNWAPGTAPVAAGGAGGVDPL